MVRQLFAAAAIGWCCVASAAEELPRLASDAPPVVADQREARAPASDEAVRTALYRVVELKLNDIRLSDAIDKLRGITGVPVTVNWKALEAAGIPRDEPLSLHVRNVHASTALDLLLRIASPEGTRLGWMIDTGVVSVSTSDDLAKNVIVRVYDIRDLIGKGVQGNNRADRVRAIMKVLTDRVDPGSWRQHGGRVATLRELQGQLIITQTAQNHRAIIDLLEAVRSLIGSGENNRLVTP